MFRKFFIGTLIVFVLSLLLWHNVSFADNSDDTDIRDAMDFAENKADNVDTAITNLVLMKVAMNVLIGKWSDNKASIESGIELTLVGALGTTAAVAANIFSGGTATITTKTAALFTLKKAIDVGVAIFAHSGYVDAMEASINAVDTQIGVIEQKKVIYSEFYDDDGTTYNGAYERHLKLLATHTGFTAADIDERVNTNDLDDDKFPHKNSVTPSHKHFGDERRKFPYEDLPVEHPCDGPCDDMFRSPHKAFSAHQTTCGDGTRADVDVVSAHSQSSVSNSLMLHWEETGGNAMSVQDLLDNRSVEQGCGRSYYKCPSSLDHRDVQEHKVRTCTRTYTNVDGENQGDCGVEFRQCMGHGRDHNESDIIQREGGHSDTDPSSDTSVGRFREIESEEAENDECSIHGASESGDHSRITPPCGDSSHSHIELFACQTGSTHATQITGYFGTFYECQPHTTYGCGHTDLTINSMYHVYKVSCTTTNGVGVCTGTNFYICQHTHTYPVPPPPAVFTPSLSLTYTSSTGSVSMTATASDPIFGADLYVRFPGDTSQYGTKIGWTSGNSNATTYSLPVNYSFPATAASGTYKFTLRVYPFNNSGSGDAWGVPYDVFEDVTVD